MNSATADRRRRVRQLPIVMLILTAIILVAVLDWGYQDQAVLGLLMGLPVAMTATLDDRRWVWLAIAVALASMFTVSYLGQLEVTETPRDPFGFDRILALVVVGFSAVLAMILQRRRMEAERARDEAVATGNLNRLLVALIAHDLRAPLVLADQALTYSYENAIRSEPSDPDLLADVSARVGRSLRMIEGILSVARNHVADRRRNQTSRVKHELAAELAAFTREAQDRGKVIDADLEPLGDGVHPIDGLLVRQVVGILVDNAIRYAPPGRVRVSGRMSDGDLVLVVADGGMQPAAETVEKGGAGLGLELCRAIAANAGGSLHIEHAGNGRTCTLRLPLGMPPTGPLVPVVKPIEI